MAMICFFGAALTSFLALPLSLLPSRGVEAVVEVDGVLGVQRFAVDLSQAARALVSALYSLMKQLYDSDSEAILVYNTFELLGNCCRDLNSL